MKPPRPLTIIHHVILKDSWDIDQRPGFGYSFASVLASALADSNARVAESAGTVVAVVEAARWRRCAARNGRSGRRASVDEHAEQRPCAVQLSLGGRGSPLGKVEVCVEGRAVDGGGGMRIM
jgi:hypothetical protein